MKHRLQAYVSSKIDEKLSIIATIKAAMYNNKFSDIDELNLEMAETELNYLEEIQDIILNYRED